MSFQGKLGVPGLPGYPGRQGIKVNKNNIVYDASCVIYITVDFNKYNVCFLFFLS